MGKGSDNKHDSSNGATPDGAQGVAGEKPFFKWDEVKKHVSRDDCWIVVNDNVYNVTKFLSKHPGGSKVINFYGGQNATVSCLFH